MREVGSLGLKDVEISDFAGQRQWIQGHER